MRNSAKYGRSQDSVKQMKTLHGYESLQIIPHISLVVFGPKAYHVLRDKETNTQTNPGGKISSMVKITTTFRLVQR